MTDYSNMSRGEAVERCIGLEREVKRMTDAVARIEKLEGMEHAARQLIGLPASVGVCEPIEGYVKRPQDIAPAVREMARMIDRDKARIEDLENLLKAHYSTQFSIK